MSVNNDFGISNAAQQSGLSAHTLRYYERIGLLDAVPRAQGGQRRYSAAELAWIAFLLRLRVTRMPIGKMLAFAELRRAGDATVANRRRMLEDHLAEVESEIDAMQQAAGQLRLKIAHYQRMEQSAAGMPRSGGTD